MADLAVHVRCTYCHDAIARGAAVHCASCLAPHHADCQAAHGRCAAPGCDDRRVLVPTPMERPTGAPSRVAPGEGKAAPRSRRLRAVLQRVLAAGLLATASLLWSRVLEPSPPATAPGAQSSPALEPSAPAHISSTPRLDRELATGAVVILARDLRLPVTLRRGERLVVRTGEDGYTHVVQEPEPGSGREPQERLVAEPGDPIALTTGRGRPVRLAPGDAVVVEEAGPDRVRVSVVPAR